MQLIRQINELVARAEGLCEGVPYNTELVNSRGVWIHFWMGDEQPTDERLEHLLRVAREQRDIVRATWGVGAPTGFWAHANIGEA